MCYGNNYIPPPGSTCAISENHAKKCELDKAATSQSSIFIMYCLEPRPHPEKIYINLFARFEANCKYTSFLKCTLALYSVRLRLLVDVMFFSVQQDATGTDIVSMKYDSTPGINKQVQFQVCMCTSYSFWCDVFAVMLVTQSCLQSQLVDGLIC